MTGSSIKPEYTASHALIIGIDEYMHASPLGYAVSDATGFAEIITEKLAFPKDNVRLLKNAEATREVIHTAFLDFATSEMEVNDRLIVFFAGHGYTHAGSRGEVGFLVPHDGDTKRLASLIRWDELTRNAELIRAKHILFIMDACYGGLAITRSLPPGTMRFVKNMLLRPARQVLTAGKANEVVADSGGPIPGHSVFTGHLIRGLEGNASTSDGVITANGLMSYVYEKVARDPLSRQTPHYGFIDGDGDLIFQAPNLSHLILQEEKDADVLISIPSAEVQTESGTNKDIVAQTKEYLSDPKFKIMLHDLVVQTVRKVLVMSSEDSFKVQGKPWSIEEFTERLNRYQNIVAELQSVVTCVGFWGDEGYHEILRKAVTRVTDRLDPESGLIVWSALRWYPIILLLYSAGIAAISSERFENLGCLFTTRVGSSRGTKASTELILAVGDAILELERTDAFKQLPGHERNYFPRSEYLFKLLQPKLDDLLFLGRDYERLFDWFEVLFALVYADLINQNHGQVWGPIGRFGWKYHSPLVENPFKVIIAEAASKQDKWPPLLAGLFGGQYKRFSDIAEQFEKLIESRPRS
jgi:uncharacterized caspase-like protein